MHMYPMTADISKMYRQIQVHPEDYDLQCILWRKSSDEPLKQYQVVTATYGTATASFLATRCLNQLASEEASSYPLAAEVIVVTCMLMILLGDLIIFQKLKGFKK